MSLIINHEANNKLANYYKSDNISYSLKSMIHFILKIQLPNKVWDLIKEFSIMSKEQIHLCRQVYCLFSSHNKPLIRNGSIVDCLYFTSMFNMCLLERLNLGYNKISDVSALGKALATNTTLGHLSLWNNQISDEDKEYLKKCSVICNLSF